MKIKYIKLRVRTQSGASEQTLRVPEWEVPVLQSIHDETENMGEICVERDALSVSNEMARLVAAYGAERQEGGLTGVPYAEAVYGSGIIGIQNLKRVMQAAVLPKETPVTPMDKPPTMRADLLVEISSGDFSADDLIGEVEEEEEEETIA